MTVKSHGTRAGYKHGCRCDQCKCAAAEYRRDLRRRHREEIGLFAGGDTPSLSLVTGSGDNALTSGNAGRRAANMATAPANSPYELANGVEAGVQAEIDGLGEHARPGLAAAALSMAKILDNPRAVSSQPAAAKVLFALLEKLRSASARGRRGNLAVVRAMASRDLGTR